MAEDNTIDIRYQDAVYAQRSGALETAARHYRAVLKNDKTYLPALNNLAATLIALGNPSEAFSCFQQGLSHHPNSPELLGNFAKFLRDNGDLEGAILNYSKCLEQNPGLSEIRYALGIILRKIGRLEDAKRHLHQSAKDLSKDARPWTALSAVALDLGEDEKAVLTISKALAISPSDPDALNMKGLIARARGNFLESKNAFDRAISIQPDHAEAHFNRGALRLLLGELPAAWNDFEWRWKDRPSPPGAPSNIPKWEGDDISGKTILVLGEQGFGDIIQFIRYALCLHTLGARVIVQCQKPLHRLIESASGVSKVVAFGEDVFANTWVPIMSLSHLFGSNSQNIPLPQGYFYQNLVTIADKFIRNIGLVWAGNERHGNDLKRSIPLSELEPILKMRNYRFFSLQMGARRKDLQSNLYGHQISDLMDDVTDFQDTLERIAQIDLLITVDTAVAHLAGAMGRKTYLLLPKVPDWRWMLHREDSPWYRSIKLFRQNNDGEWKHPIKKIVDLLSD